MSFCPVVGIEARSVPVAAGIAAPPPIGRVDDQHGVPFRTDLEAQRDARVGVHDVVGYEGHEADTFGPQAKGGHVDGALGPEAHPHGPHCEARPKRADPVAALVARHPQTMLGPRGSRRKHEGERNPPADAQVHVHLYLLPAFHDAHRAALRHPMGMPWVGRCIAMCFVRGEGVR